MKGLDADFRFLFHWKVDAITRDTGLSEGALRAACVEFWIPSTAHSGVTGEELASLTSMHYRGCPDCAAAGFHTALYQCRFVDVCEVHDYPLFEKCEECGEVHSYTLRGMKRSPLPCACGKEEFDVFSMADQYRDCAEDLNSTLLGYGSWLAVQRSAAALVPRSDCHVLDDDGTPRFAFATGSVVERFVTSSAAVNPEATPPPLLGERYRNVATFEVQSGCMQYLDWEIKVSGQRAASRYVGWSIRLPIEQQHSHHGQGGLDLLQGHITKLLTELRGLGSDNHRHCYEAWHRLKQLTGEDINEVILCPFVTLLEQLRRRWEYILFVKQCIRAVSQQLDLHAGQESDVWISGAQPIVAAELACYLLQEYVGDLAQRALPWSISQADLTLKDLVGPEFSGWNEGAFAATVTRLRRSIDYPYGRSVLRVAILERFQWRRSWAELCEASSQHWSAVQARVRAIEERMPGMRAHIDWVRSRK